MNLQVPQLAQSGFSRKTQKFRTVTFSNAPPSKAGEPEQPSSSRSHFFQDSKTNKNELKEENEISTTDVKEYKGKNAFLYNYLQDFLHFTLGKDDDEDINHKIEEETQLKKELTEIPQLFRQNTKITNKRRPDFLLVTNMDKIEKVYVDYDIYPDKLPLKKMRKSFILTFRHLEKFSQKLVKSSIFEIFSLLVILMNCVTYILKENKRGEYNTYLEIINRFETSFLIFYLIEMSLKQIAFGLFLDKYAYFRDGWNVLDFFVIINLVLLNYNVSNGIIKDYSLLRIIRLLRPLRALTHISKLRAIISSVLAALPLLLDFLGILMFFFLIYAAVGLHLFGGLLLYRCYDVQLGTLSSPETVCGNLQCPSNGLCLKGLNNLNGGVINFDNLFSSLLQVILISTLDNWTVTMYNIERAFTNYAWIYFVSLVIFGNYILLNLTLALIKVKFSETHNNIKNEKKNINRTIRTYELTEIKRQGLWISKRKADPIEVKPKVSKQMSAYDEDEIKENNEENKNILKLLKDLTPLNLKNQDSRAMGSNHQSILKKSSKIEVGKRRRVGNAFGSSSYASSKSKTFKSYKSHSSSIMSKRHKNKILPPALQKNSKFESHYSSESLLSFISMDDSRSKIIRNNKINKCLRYFFRIFGKVVKIIPYRKNTKHQTIFHLEPKYLKLLVNFEKEYKSISEEDILPNKDEEEKKKLMKEQINIINKKKLPIIYAPKKKKASLLKFLRQYPNIN